jgi:hypothetical protein
LPTSVRSAWELIFAERAVVEEEYYMLVLRDILDQAQENGVAITHSTIAVQ